MSDDTKAAKKPRKQIVRGPQKVLAAIAYTDENGTVVDLKKGTLLVTLSKDYKAAFATIQANPTAVVLELEVPKASAE